MAGTHSEFRAVSDDGMAPVQVIECATCGAEDHVVSSRGGRLPPEALEKIFTRKGWSVHRTGRHACPECNEKENAVAEPRKMDLKDRRRIIARLVEVYDDVNARYCDNITDASVAKDLGMPPAWVETLREENFGPDGRNVEMDRIAAAIGALHANAEQLSTDALAVAARGEDLSAVAQELRKRLDAIAEAIGPRAAKR